MNSYTLSLSLSLQNMCLYFIRETKSFNLSCLVIHNETLFYDKYTNTKFLKMKHVFRFIGLAKKRRSRLSVLILNTLFSMPSKVFFTLCERLINFFESSVKLLLNK